MQKGVGRVYLLIGLLILGVIALITPWPYYYVSDLCDKANGCPKEWRLGTSLGEKLFTKYIANNSNSQPTSIPSSTADETTNW